MVVELDFCVLKFTKNYIISTVNENIHLTESKAALISKEIVNYFKGNPFIYISHRIHNYTVEPHVYKIVSKNKNLLGIIVVSNDKSLIKKSISEKPLLNNQPFFEIFNDLEDALFWANTFSKKNE
ncbi:hypothetical protein ACFS5M_07250 [Lacinutrix iliipiscaria]|uniref:STAS/SEC14 domain-containing protein n=1 Tax=Lacinutrix iliipiscaria TaxID=1230532 RepID=A0ABW5WPB5_9FLAO